MQTTGGPGNDSYTMISALFALLDIPCEAVPYDGGQEAIKLWLAAMWILPSVLPRPIATM